MRKRVTKFSGTVFGAEKPFLRVNVCLQFFLDRLSSSTARLLQRPKNKLLDKRSRKNCKEV
jgi:hypothetical protein